MMPAGEVGTWQDVAVQPLPNGHLDIILVETRLEGNGAKNAITWEQAGKL